MKIRLHIRLSVLFAIALFLALSPPVTGASADEPKPALEGRWEGLLQDAGNSIVVGFEFKPSEGNMQVSFYADDWDLAPIALGTAKFENGEIQTVIFKGKQDSTGALAGTLDFGPFGIPGLTTPLILKRVEKPAAQALPVAVKSVQPQWSLETRGEVWSSPSVADGAVYVGSDDRTLYAVDARTGHLNWQFETGGPVRSRAAVAGGSVYFLSNDGYLYAVDARSGKLRWKFDTRTSLVPHTGLGPSDDRWDYLQSSPAVADGIVYVGSGNSNIYAIDAATGQERWHVTTGDSVRSSPVVKNGVVYIGSWDHMVYALDAKTGAEKWTFDTKGIIQASPTLTEGVLFIGSRYPYEFALDSTTGQEKWRFNYFGSWVESTAAAQDGLVFVGSSDYCHLFAIDATNGHRKWGFKTGGYSWCSPAAAGGLVYIGTARASERHKDGAHFFAVDVGTGKPVWSFTVGRREGSYLQGVVSSPVVAEGMVYFGSLDGKLYALPAR